MLISAMKSVQVIPARRMFVVGHILLLMLLGIIRIRLVNMEIQHVTLHSHWKRVYILQLRLLSLRGASREFEDSINE